MTDPSPSPSEADLTEARRTAHAIGNFNCPCTMSGIGHLKMCDTATTAIAAALARVRAEEREACAKEADFQAMQAKLAQRDGEIGSWCAEQTANVIAAAIRSRAPGESEGG